MDLDNLKWSDFHPSWHEKLRDELLLELEQGNVDIVKLGLMQGYPELREMDPRFPALYEEGMTEFGPFLLDKSQTDGSTPWQNKSPLGRRALWKEAMELLEQGHHQILFQRTLVKYPELMDIEPKLRELWETKPAVLPSLTPWQLQSPKEQERILRNARFYVEEARFRLLLADLEQYPELIPQDIRFQETWAFYQANPPEEDWNPPPMRWVDFSPESQRLIIESVNDPRYQNEAHIEDRLESYPEMKKLPEVKEAKKLAQRLDRESRHESGDFTWRELGKELQAEAVARALEDLEGGLLDGVEDALSQFPPLRHKDPRLFEIWEAMRKGKPREEDEFGWEGLTEPSRRFVLKAALRQIESAPHGTKLLLESYPELRTLDDRLADFE